MLPSIVVYRVSWLWWRRTRHVITGCLTTDSFRLWLDGEPAFHLCKANKGRSTLMTFKHGEIVLDTSPRMIAVALFGLQIVKSYALRMGW